MLDMVAHVGLGEQIQQGSGQWEDTLGRRIPSIAVLALVFCVTVCCASTVCNQTVIFSLEMGSHDTSHTVQTLMSLHISN